MTREETYIETERLILRSWRPADLDDITRLLSDPLTMNDYRGPFNQEMCRAKLDDYHSAFQRLGYIRWNVSTKAGEFLGYTGLYPNGDDHPLGAHADIGWRYLPTAWGHGYATEAANATLHHAFDTCGLNEVLAYTQIENIRSQAVISRLPFQRDATRDFTIIDEIAGPWHGMTWVARP